MISPRKYQQEILEFAKRKNILAFLPTGSGKTYIAVKLIQHQLQLMKLNPSTIKQVIVFIAPTKVLVCQQLNYLLKHLNLTDIVKGKSYTGDDRCSWSCEDWKIEASLFDILVMTPEIFRQLLCKRFLPFTTFNTVILDECHHAFGNNPMAQICEQLKSSSAYRPKIFGMTASPLPCKKGSTCDIVSQLEENTSCELKYPYYAQDELLEMNPATNLSILRYVSGNNYFQPQFMIDLNSVALAVLTKTRMNTRTINATTNNIAVMYHALLRLKQINIFATICKLLRCEGCLPPCALDSLAGLHIPDNIIDLQNWSLSIGKAVSVDSECNKCTSISSSSSAMLSSTDRETQGVLISVYPEISEFINKLAAVMSVGEDCGLICALHVLKKSMLPKVSSVNDQMKNMTTKEFDKTQLAKLGSELQNSLFSMQSVLNSARAVCCSIMDFCTAIFGHFSPDICEAATRRLQHKYRPATASGCNNHATSEYDDYDDDQQQIDLCDLWCQLTFPALADALVTRMVTTLHCPDTRRIMEIEIGSNGILEYFEELESSQHSTILSNVLTVTDLRNAMVIACEVFLDILSGMETELVYDSSVDDYNEESRNDDVFSWTRCDHTEEIESIEWPKEEAVDIREIYFTTSELEMMQYKYDMVSNKAKTLFYALSSSCQDCNDSIVAIVFCQSKVTVSALSSLAKTLELEHLRFDHIVGRDNQNDQVKILSQFKSGEFNVLFATSVAEEGIHVQDCNLVINFDHPSTQKSYLQRRGRARAKDSVMLALVPVGKQGKTILQDYKDYVKQEQETIVRAHAHGFDAGRPQSRDTGKRSREESSFSSASGSEDDVHRTLTVASGCDKKVSKSNESRKHVWHEYLIDDVIPACLVGYCTGEHSEDELDCSDTFDHGDIGNVEDKSSSRCIRKNREAVSDDTLCSPSSAIIESPMIGDILNSKNSSSFLSQYLTAVNGECRKEIENVGNSFRCSITLPLSIPQSLRFVVGPVARNKIIAKALAAMECMKMLKKHGKVNACYQPAENVRRINKAIEQNIPVTVATISSKRAQEMAEVMSVKVVANKLLPVEIHCPNEYWKSSSNLVTSRSTELYFYATRANFSSEDYHRKFTNCPSCSQHFEGLNSVGIAFMIQLPTEIVREYFQLSLRQEWVDANIIYLGSKQVSDEDLWNMQRFHKSIYCWEYDTSVECTSLNANSWVNLESSFHHLHHQPTSPSKWSESSNGCWYCLFPLPEELTAVDDNGCFPIYEVDEPIVIAEFNDPRRWTKYLCKCANEAEVLIRNLHILDNVWGDESIRQKYFNGLDSYDRPKNLSGLLVSSGGGPEAVVQQKYQRCSQLIDLCGERSYLSIFKDRYSSHHKLLDELSCDPDHRLITLIMMSTKLSATPWINAQKTADIINTRVHGAHGGIRNHIPELQQPLGKVQWLLVGYNAPSIVWRIQSLLLALEAAAYVKVLHTHFSMCHVTNFPVQSQLVPSNILINRLNILQCSAESLPSASLMLRATTPTMCEEAFDSEVLEFLGDSLLKFVTTVEVYRLYPSEEEGVLTTERKRFINNSFLADNCRKIGISKYLRPLRYSSGKQTINFRPSGCTSNIAGGTSVVHSMWNRHLCTPNNLPSEEYECESLQFFSAEVKSKVLADLIEAIIGAFYHHGGLNAGVAAIQALGVWPTRYDDSYPSHAESCQRSHFQMNTSRASLPCDPSFPCLPFQSHCESPSSDEAMPITSEELGKIASRWKYDFNSLDVLVEALCHPSAARLTASPSNQRLEFFGDAVLDIVVVAYLYRNQQNVHQGQLSEQKSAATDNKNLGKFGIRQGLQCHIRGDDQLHSDCCHIETSILTAIKRLKCGRIQAVESIYEDLLRQKPTACKAIADCFEAIVGAMYLDCQDLAVIEDVLARIGLFPQL